MVSTFVQPDFTSQSETDYKTALDDAASVFARMAAAFAPSEAATPDMTVSVLPGFLSSVGSLPLEVGSQATVALTAPGSQSQIYIVHISTASGVVGISSGAVSGSPVDPAIPAATVAVARVTVVQSQTSIANSDIDDLRAFFSVL